MRNRPTADVSLDEIRRLLMLLLVKAGATSEEIAAALGVDASTIRRTLPSRKVKPFGRPNA